jgi:hypothetical protein
MRRALALVALVVLAGCSAADVPGEVPGDLPDPPDGLPGLPEDLPDVPDLPDDLPEETDWTPAPEAPATPTGAPDGGSTATPTADRAPTATPVGSGTPVPDGEFAGVTFPPGTSPTRVTNVTALAGANVRALSTRGFVATYVDHSGPAGERTDRTTVVRSSPAAERSLSRFDAADLTIVTYRNATARHRYRAVDDDTSLRVRDADRTFAGVHRDAAGLANASVDLLRAANFTDPERVERDNRTVVRYRLAGIEDPPGEATVTRAEGYLVVDQRGVIREYRIAVDVEADGERTVVRRRYRLERTGNVTVQRPGWAD